MLQQSHRTREAGVDLYRIIGLLFVTLLHSHLYTGYYNEFQGGNTSIWLANLIRWLTYGCNAMFILMTGYLKSTTTWNKRYYKSLVAVIVGYTLTCLITYPICHFLLGEEKELMTWILWWINFKDYAWYIELYLCLFLISPVINLALNAITDNKQLWILVASLLFVSVAHSVTGLPILPDIFETLYPIAIYTLGAAIRRTQPKPDAAMCIGGTVLIAALLAFMTLATAEGTFSTGFSQSYGGFWVVAMITLLFLALYQLQVKPKARKVLTWLAGGVFEGYLLSRVLDLTVYPLVPQWHTPKTYPLVYLCISIPIFICSILAGKCVNTAAGRITTALWRKMEKPVPKAPTETQS